MKIGYLIVIQLATCYFAYSYGKNNPEGYINHKITDSQYVCCVLVANEYPQLADEAHKVKTDRDYDILMRHLQMILSSK